MNNLSGKECRVNFNKKRRGNALVLNTNLIIISYYNNGLLIVNGNHLDLATIMFWLDS